MFNEYKKIRGQSITNHILLVAGIALIAGVAISNFGGILQKQTAKTSQGMAGIQTQDISQLVEEADGYSNQSYLSNYGFHSNSSTSSRTTNNSRATESDASYTVVDGAVDFVEGTLAGLKNQAEGLIDIALHPVDTAKSLYALAEALINDPKGTIAAIGAEFKGDVEALLSGDLKEVGRIVGENVNPASLVRIAAIIAKVDIKGGRKNSNKDDEVTKGPLWTSTNSKSAVENAFGHYKKHKSEFPEFQNAKQYVEGAKKFLNSPPKGTLTKSRSNGDTLLYNPKNNTFGVKDINGAPRTMFRPKGGIDYWNKQ